MATEDPRGIYDETELVVREFFAGAPADRGVWHACRAIVDARKEVAALRDLANAVIPSDFDGTGCEDVGGVNWFDRRVALGGECPYAQQRNRDAAFRAKYAIETTPGGDANNVPAARPK